MTIYDPDGLEFCPSRCPRRRHLDYIFNGEPFTPMGTDDKSSNFGQTISLVDCGSGDKQ